MNQWKQWLDDKLGPLKRPNKVVELVEQSIVGNVHKAMKEAISVSEVATFATMMRSKIQLPDGTLVPVNSISFIIAKSGASKDRSLNAARKCFSSKYENIKEYLQTESVRKAQTLAAEAGEDDWRPFHIKPRSLFGGAKPTVSGIVSHLNSMQDLTVGGGHVYTGEFGSELSQGSAMMELLQFTAEIYDLGNMKADWRKTEEAQNSEITNMNFSGIFISSPGHILYDQAIKKKFLTEFTTKLARRSFFNFNNTELNHKPETVDALLEREDRELRESLNAIDEVTKLIHGITPTENNIFTIDDEVWKVYGVLKRYYEEEAEKIDPELESYKLSLQHTQWRVLKLSGAYCQVRNGTSISLQDFAEALHYCESTEVDIRQFNIELNKEKYELLDDYMNSIYCMHPITLSAHKLSKMEYIENTRALGTKLNELVDMANTISQGVYSVENTNIKYEKLISTQLLGASYMQVKGSKEERAKQCSEGFQYKEVDFDYLSKLLNNDLAYCPFEFQDGKRSNENIVNGCSWICLDVDDSDITDGEAHNMLEDFRHHICRTSNSENPFKFRVIIELDKYIDIEQKLWKKFVGSICDYLGIEADLLPQSQIYFGYKGRKVLSNTAGEPLEVKEHLIYTNAQVEKEKPLSIPKQREMLEDEMGTFWYAFEMSKGGRSLALIRAARHAKDLNATEYQVVNLMWTINNYWVHSLDEEEVERTVISQISRWYE